MRKILKIIGITLLILILLTGGAIFCAIKWLESGRITPMIERLADENINGKLSVRDVRFGFRPRYPFLGVEIKDLCLISHAFDSLTPAERGIMPVYADSLLALDYLAGALDIKRFLHDNEVALHDVEMRGLSVNIVVAHNGKANYEIISAKPDSVAESTKKKMPGFRINKFSLRQPKEIRFYNAADSTSASVLLLTDAAVEGDSLPTYRLRINGNVTSPKATLLTNLQDINFGINGKVFWDPAEPGLIAMDKMELQGAFLKAVVTGEMDFTDNPIIRKADIDVAPVALENILTLLPDSIRQLHRLHAPYFSTDLVIGGNLKLTEAMDLTTDTIPSANLRLYVPRSELTYDNIKFKDVELDLTATTAVNAPDSTVIDVRKLKLKGPATDFEASVILSTPLSNPTFITDMKGDINLADIPKILRKKIPGYLTGLVSTDLHAEGSSSMLVPEHLHHINAEGSVNLRNIFFLMDDMDKMVQLTKGRIDFTSDKMADGMPLLNTKLNVDSANILVGGVDIACSSLNLDTHLKKTAPGPNAATSPTTSSLIKKPDSKAVSTNNKTGFLGANLPVEGKLKVGRLNIISITDSAGARIRNVEGVVTLRSMNEKKPLPDILAVLTTGTVSAGTLTDRILINNTKINAELHKLATVVKGGIDSKGSKDSANPKNKASGKDSGKGKDVKVLNRSKVPSPEEVFRMAYLKRHHKPGEKRKRRVYGALDADDNEVLEWDLAKGFSKFLNEWELKGTVSSRQARMLLTVFPMPNRFSRIDVNFNNDTVGISGIALRTGKTDVTLSGLVTNVRRALTSKTDNTLKLNLSLLCDTIDINQLSAGIMTGASYASRHRNDKSHFGAYADDSALEAHMKEIAKEGAKTPAPFLIPLNIDANLRLEADNVLYSDLLLQHMGGDILVHDGGVNLNKIKADSDAGDLSLSALYSAPKPDNIYFGFGMDLKDFNIAKFVKLVPAVDSIVPLVHDFSGTVGASVAATCHIDSTMNLKLPTLDAAIRITGENLAFVDPHTYRTLGKWLGFKDKADNTIHHLNVEMTVDDGIMRVYPFVFNIDRYKLGVSGSNDIAMNFDYHIAVLKSPIPFKFGINISGNPKKYKVRFGGAKFKEDTAIESVSVVNNAQINLIDQIENVFKRGVQNSHFSKLPVVRQVTQGLQPDPGLSAADSLQLIREGLLEPSR